jgi:hypothetical protein
MPTNLLPQLRSWLTKNFASWKEARERRRELAFRKRLRRWTASPSRGHSPFDAAKKNRF